MTQLLTFFNIGDETRTIAVAQLESPDELRTYQPKTLQLKQNDRFNVVNLTEEDEWESF